MVELNCFNWVQLVKKADMPSNAKLISFYLSTFMNAEHNIAWPSQSRIAHETGLSERTVIRQLQWLNKNKWLISKKAVKYVDTGRQTYAHNEYIINIPDEVINNIRGEMMSPRTIAGVTNSTSRGDKSDGAGVTQCHTNNNVNNNRNNNVPFSSKNENQSQNQKKSAKKEGFTDMVERVAKERGISAKPGEDYQEFWQRIKQKSESYGF